MDMKDFIAGAKVDDRSVPPPQVKLKKGGWIGGTYLGSKTFPYQGKPTTAYTLKAEKWDGATFETAGKPVGIAEGETVRIFGAYLTDKLTPSDVGARVVIGSEGEGERKAGKNAAKVLTVKVLAGV